MTVPSTPTATDRQEEVRKLNVEIALLKTKKEEVARAAAGEEERAQDARVRRETIQKELDTLHAEMMALGADTRGFLQDLREAIAHSLELHNVVLELYKKEAELYVAMQENVRIARLEKDKILESINREQELMSTQRRDLDIYHRRIEKAAAEHLPGQKVVI